MQVSSETLLLLTSGVKGTCTRGSSAATSRIWMSWCLTLPLGNRRMPKTVTCPGCPFVGNIPQAEPELPTQGILCSSRPPLPEIPMLTRGCGVFGGTNTKRGDVAANTETWGWGQAFLTVGMAVGWAMNIVYRIKGFKPPHQPRRTVA